MLITSVTITTLPFMDNDIVEDMERIYFPEMKSTSSFDLYADVAQILCCFKILITRIKTMERFSAGHESGKSGFTYLCILILAHRREDDITLFLDGMQLTLGLTGTVCLMQICSKSWVKHFFVGFIRFLRN